jgi:hypothetical protein
MKGKCQVCNNPFAYVDKDMDEQHVKDWLFDNEDRWRLAQGGTTI